MKLRRTCKAERSKSRALVYSTLKEIDPLSVYSKPKGQITVS